MSDDYRKGFEDGIRCFAWWKDGVQMVGNCGTTLERALAGVENRHGFNPPRKSKFVTLQHGETGRLLTWPTNKPIPHGYAVALWHGIEPCGDCDPCLGGRPDQCAVSPLCLHESTRTDQGAIVCNICGITLAP